MSATCKFYGFNGAGPTGATVDSADSASFKFGRDDTLISATSLPIPTAAGTKASYLKYLGLDVTVLGATNISNRKVSVAAAPSIPAGTAMWYAAQKTYTQNTGTQDATVSASTAGNYPGDDTSHNISAITLALQHVAAPTNTVNGAGLGTTGQTAIPVTANGTNYQKDQSILLGAGSANAEIVTVTGTPTGTSIPCSATTKTHASGDVLGLAYQPLTTTATVYDSSSISSGSTGLNGAYLQLVFLVDNSFTGGGGALALPNVVLTYDEA